MQLLSRTSKLTNNVLLPVILLIWMLSAKSAIMDNHCDGFPPAVREVTALAIHQTGRWIAYGFMESTFDRCTLTQGLRVLDRETSNEFSLLGNDVVTSISWRANSSELAYGTTTGYIVHYDIQQAVELNRYQISTQLITSVEWNSAGTLVLSAGWDNALRISDTNGQVLNLITFPPTGLPGLQSGILRAQWSPSNGYVMIAGGESRSSVSIWNPSGNSFSLIREIQVSNDGFVIARYNHAGTRIAASTSDGGIEIWDAQSGQRLTRSAAYPNGNAVFAWSPDDSELAVISPSKSLEIWDPQSGQLIRSVTDGSTFHVDWNEFIGIVYAQSLAYSYNGDGTPIDPGIPVNIPVATSTPTPTPIPSPTPTPVLNTVILSPTPANPLTLSEETRAWYNYTITLSATLTGSESVTVRLDYYPPTPNNYAHVQTRVQRDPPLSWTTAQTLVFDANHTEYEVRIRARDDSTNLTGAVGRLSHRITASNVAGYAVNTVDSGGTRLTGSPFNGGNDASAAADSRNVLVFTVTDND